MSAINPLTASAFLEIARKGGHKSIVLTAAASSLGQMINRLGQSEGVQLINIVRREAQVELLKAVGAMIVINSSLADFEQQLHDVCHKYSTRLAFDSVAGPMTGQLLKALPEGSKVSVFSALSNENVQVGPDQYIFENKSVDGFWLGPWLFDTKN